MESVEQFLARGGQITKLTTAASAVDYSKKYVHKEDRKLRGKTKNIPLTIRKANNG